MQKKFAPVLTPVANTRGVYPFTSCGGEFSLFRCRPGGGTPLVNAHDAEAYANAPLATTALNGNTCQRIAHKQMPEASPADICTSVRLQAGALRLRTGSFLLKLNGAERCRRFLVCVDEIYVNLLLELTIFASIAQLGERQTEDLKVPGSIPGGGTHRSGSSVW